jgi:hypothetical protein
MVGYGGVIWWETCGSLMMFKSPTEAYTNSPTIKKHDILQI